MKLFLGLFLIAATPSWSDFPDAYPPKIVKRLPQSFLYDGDIWASLSPSEKQSNLALLNSLYADGKSAKIVSTHPFVIYRR